MLKCVCMKVCVGVWVRKYCSNMRTPRTHLWPSPTPAWMAFTVRRSMAPIFLPFLGSCHTMDFQSGAINTWHAFAEPLVYTWSTWPADSMCL